MVPGIRQGLQQLIIMANQTSTTKGIIRIDFLPFKITNMTVAKAFHMVVF